MIIPGEWVWYGNHGHYICGRWCRFHMLTEIGKYFVSTVGNYVHPRHSHGMEYVENDWIRMNPDGEGLNANDDKYETMVFKTQDRCRRRTCGKCNQPLSKSGTNLAFAGYKLLGDATRGHRLMCEKFAMLDEVYEPIPTTENVVQLISAAMEDNWYGSGVLPILADGLEEAEYHNKNVLAVMRGQVKGLTWINPAPFIGSLPTTEVPIPDSWKGALGLMPDEFRRVKDTGLLKDSIPAYRPRLRRVKK